MAVSVKICGLDRSESVVAAVLGGTCFAGFVFYPPSPRNLSPDQAAILISAVPDTVAKVGLFVDPEDKDIDAVLKAEKLDIIQLHGSETPVRVSAVKAHTGLPVMKVVPLANKKDLQAAERYYPVADRLLFDAKPPSDMKKALPGGNALSFDWQLLSDADIPLPWMLAGGLTPENLAEAVAISGTDMVDVSSGVESAPGVKDVGKIRAFLQAANSL